MSNTRYDGSSGIDGINDNTYELLFKDISSLDDNEKGSIDDFHTLETLDIFTRIHEKKIFSKILKIYYKHIDINLDRILFNEVTKQYEYRDNDKVITFDMLSDYFDDDIIHNELVSKKRYNKCHSRSVNVSKYIEDSKIVTGYITIMDHKYLHSVIEVNEDNDIYFLDWTRNLKMLKKDYISLTNFIELASFEGTKAIEDIDIIFGKMNMSVKPYVLFRDELRKDIEKNIYLFKEGKSR